MATRPRPWTDPATLANVAAVAMAGMSIAFGWILLVDLRLYGALPDPSLVPIQLLLIAATVAAFTRRRWATALAAVVALAAGIGSAVQPITMTRLTEPETLSLQVATVLLLTFAATAVTAGTTATAKARRNTRVTTGRSLDGEDH